MLISLCTIKYLRQKLLQLTLSKSRTPGPYLFFQSMHIQPVLTQTKFKTKSLEQGFEICSMLRIKTPERRHLSQRLFFTIMYTQLIVYTQICPTMSIEECHRMTNRTISLQFLELDSVTLVKAFIQYIYNLHIQENKISELHHTASFIQHIYNLDIQENKISELQHTTSFIQHIYNLDIQENKISALQQAA